MLDLAGLPGLRIEHTLTRRVLTAIPAAHEHYRPQLGARSAGELARHSLYSGYLWRRALPDRSVMRLPSHRFCSLARVIIRTEAH